jgi:tRNA A37 methylthiotransferase MiaB
MANFSFHPQDSMKVFLHLSTKHSIYNIHLPVQSGSNRILKIDAYSVGIRSAETKLLFLIAQYLKDTIAGSPTETELKTIKIR